MQTPILYIIILVLLVGFSLLFYFLLDLKKKAEKPTEDGSLKVMMEWMKDIKSGTEATREGMQKSINETNKAINERLDNAGRVIAQLTKELGGISQVGPDIRRLTETLASPKLRGNFGEEMLENMLSQSLPQGGYQMQYKFKNGETVDSIIRVGETILPIDSKFSMENFRSFKEAKTDEAADALKKAFLKDVKKRVDEIHKKYILPQEGTFDFALMYVPSEGVYQEVILDEDLMLYARNKRVMPVSPNSLFIYLQNIIVSLRGQEVNKVATQILTMINGIKQESDKFAKNLDVLGNHIKNAGNTMGTVQNDFAKLKTSIGNASSLKLEEKNEQEKLLVQ
jgi:DNA recombination protein RmuC